MSGWMEILVGLQSQQALPQPIEAIVPTVVIPFAIAGALLSSLIAAIAGFFGIHFKAGGMRRLLGFLLRPKILVTALVFNAVGFGGYAVYQNEFHRARPLWWIQHMNARISRPSTRAYTDNWNLNPRMNGPSSASKADRSLRGVSLTWKKKLPSGSFRGISLSGDSIFLGADNGYIYELDRHSGETLRRFYVGQPVTPMPIVWNGTLFAGEGQHLTHHARIYAFDLKTGRLRGTVSTKGHTEGDLVIAEQNGRTLLFAPAGKDGLYAIDPRTLETVWHRKIGHFDSGVSVVNGRVFASTGIEKGTESAPPALYALSFQTGDVIWKTELSASGWSRAIFSEREVCVGLGEIYRTRDYGQLACYDQENGEPHLALNFGAPLFNTPIPFVLPGDEGPKTLVTDLKGNACLVDLNDMTHQWCARTKVDANLYAAAAIGDSRYLILGATDGLRIFDTFNHGREVARWSPSAKNDAWQILYAGVSVGDDGWYLIDKTGVVRKLVPHYL